MNKDTAREYLPLVRALADGRSIQHQKTDGTWIDEIELSFDWPAHRYRIKRNPKEFWFNRYDHGVMHGPYASKQMAIEHSMNFAEQVCFREVI